MKYGLVVLLAVFILSLAFVVIRSEWVKIPPKHRKDPRLVVGLAAFAAVIVVTVVLLACTMLPRIYSPELYFIP